MNPTNLQNHIDISFREAKSDDLPILIKLLHSDTLGMTRESLDEKSRQRYQSAFKAISQDKHAQLMLAIHDNKIIAMAQINFIDYLTYQGGRRAQIEGVRVDDNYRGQGIGKKLIKHLIQLSIQHGCHMVQLTTNKQRPAAIRFYESLGFRASHEGMKLDLKLNVKL